LIASKKSLTNGNKSGLIESSMDSNKRPFAVWVISVGLIFSGLDLLYGLIPDLSRPSLFDPFLSLVLGFVVLCFLSAIGTFLTRRRWSFVMSVIVSLGFVVPSLVVYPKPTDFATFSIATSSILVLILVAAFSLLCLINLKKGLNQKKYLSSPRSIGGALTIVLLLFVVLGVTYAAFSASNTSTLALVSVSIVPGASNPSNGAGHFVPSTITVVIGVNNTITWVNKDYSIHTVTSNSGLFNSGLLNSGDKWGYTFSKAGTFGYRCAIHPYMTGTVIVKNS
jgi:plastocyanin